ncbi:cilia- and flagella-associated protein 44-like [Octopus sinensis]|uniref:Cilia- and flagella-associated protein 44 n=1 Tax=Octopus sinensis TaxID=2607531 RepID=A0A6P7SEH9_9MOLL|nr:cilia- and flagella-associated protein 44-like [Octopus sinensis]XP_036359326.1 cilia- and flagella-associated protein 44-like [Octopus sinensis]
MSEDESEKKTPYPRSLSRMESQKPDSGPVPGTSSRSGSSNEEGSESTVYFSSSSRTESDFVFSESEKEEKVVKKVIPEDFFYDYEEFKYRPFVTEDSGLPEDMLDFKYSLGYDCTRRCNLSLLDNDTVMFATGNIITIINVKTGERSFVRGTSAGGISAIQLHPKKTFFAVGEKQNFPSLNIFEVPSFKLYRILREGTTHLYSFLDFSPDGALLASQGGEPDYMLTLWNWSQEQIVLRCKAFSQEIYRVSFSADLEGYLTTAGMGHIRFWKMANTFTGLKLQGYLGKFGKTEMSDIEGYVELPDGKVVSSCEWGNLLVWDGGLIKVQIGRKNNKTCHVGHIQQIFLDEGELMTIGQDGYIRVWDFETMDTADSVDESGMFIMEPMNELKVGAQQNVQLYCMRRQEEQEEQDAVLWYAQDANGGIWELDLTFSHTSRVPKKLFSFHAGSIKAIDCSPIANLLATTGVDHTIRIFDIDSNKQLSEKRFVAGGTCLIWISEKLCPKGSHIIAGFEDGVVRLFEISKPVDQGITRKGKSTCDMQLYQVIKLHKMRINSMEFNAEETILATTGEDRAVFFSKFTKYLTLEPIGFVESPHLPKKLLWFPNNVNKILIICERNSVVEFETPQEAEFDTEHTYFLEALKPRIYTFKSIKSILLHEEELEIERKLEEERLQMEELERQRRRDRGEESDPETEETEEKEESKEEVVEDTWEPYIPEVPSPILCGMYSPDGRTFWLTLGDYDAGYIYECAFPGERDSQRAIPDSDPATPLRAVAVVNNNDAGITIMKFSKFQTQLLLGMTDGKIRVHHLPVPGSIKELGPYWEFGIHDSDYGYLTGLVVNFQDNCLITSGADGNIFIFSYMSLDKIEEKIVAAEPYTFRAKEKHYVDDLEDSTAYSIEDAKQKAEYDRIMAEANQKKDEVHQHIALLRRDYKHLIEQNACLPENLRLSPKEFEIDTTIKEEVFSQIDKKIQEAKMKVSWITEKHSLALMKLRKFYKDYVKWDRIVVYAFNSPYKVSTTRLPCLPNNFYQKKSDLDQKKNGKRFTLDGLQQKELDVKKDAKAGDAEGKRSGARDSVTASSLKGVAGERILKALQKVEEIKQKRVKRKEQWDKLYSEKPADDYEDPNDLAAIKEAKENMGDYKLKTAEDYVVPDLLRMNTTKARLKLFLLVEHISQYISDFNEKILELRNEKKKLVNIIAFLHDDIYSIQSNMSAEQRLSLSEQPKMVLEETPEKKYDFETEDLIFFKNKLLSVDNSLVLGIKEQTLKEQETTPATAAPKHASRGSMVLTKSSNLGVFETKEELFNQMIDNENFERSTAITKMEIMQAEELEIRNQYKRDDLLRKIEQMKADFDARLCLLRHEKFLLDVLIKKGNLREITAFEELVLLKEYEKYENIIAEKVEERFKEKLDMERKVQECQAKIDSKIKDIEKLLERERALHGTLVTTIGENKFADYLIKVFKKKIKRSKKKETEGTDEESDGSSSEDSDITDTDEGSESESAAFDLDVCPSGCDQALYDTTCTMREKRLDIEDQLMEERKNQEAFKKDMDALNKKAKVINTSLEKAQNDLEAFQLEKQRKLNELDVTVTLLLQQIQYTVGKKFPNDISKALVFRNNQILQLNNRIKELQAEKNQQKRNKQDERLKHCQLLRDKRQFEQIIGQLEDTCNKMIEDKFGRLVDMETVETVTVHRTNAELEERAHQTEHQLRANRYKEKESILQLRRDISVVTKENTDLTGQLRILLEEQHLLEARLGSRQKNLGEEFRGESQQTIDELERLEQLCDLQTQEIFNLKKELIILSRKGGHILPPIEPPTPHIDQT